MTQLHKYLWLVDTVRRAGHITFESLSARWQQNLSLSDGQPLPRATFNRWREAIHTQFGVNIACSRAGGYLYYIANPEDIDTDELQRWMLDTFALGSLIGDNLALHDRILVDPIPSGQPHLVTLLQAMHEGHTVSITYRSFSKTQSHTFPIAPYCVKLFEGRWYVLAQCANYNELRIYALDRIACAEPLADTFSLPAGFSAAAHFAPYYGIVADSSVRPCHIVIRATAAHAPYMRSLPLHPSQRVLSACDTHTDFELYLAPTYDFIMRLLQAGPMIEVVSPASLRRQLKDNIARMAALYADEG